MPAQNSQFSRLLYAASENNADQLYFSEVFVPDPFLSFTVADKKYALVNMLEFDRVQKESSLDVVLSYEEWAKKLVLDAKNSLPDIADIILLLQREFDLPGFCISSDFPAGLAFKLKDLGVDLEIATGGLFPEREVKSLKEAEAIREGNKASVAGFFEFERILKESEVKDGYIIYEGEKLTSEFAREAIIIACLKAGAANVLSPIVAGGVQACDPHCIGQGPLRANELIIVDIFPRVMNTGYFGDMTRTYCKGNPTAEMRSLVESVLEAQQDALTKIRAGVCGQSVYEGVKKYFDTKGFLTERQNGANVGFIHGLGHGLGLDVHESPRVSRVKSILKKGQVVTVEPGLYYPEIGGCRWEDVVWVRDDGVELLSDHPYDWVF